jgi:hypothetical protein
MNNKVKILQVQIPRYGLLQIGTQQLYCVENSHICVSKEAMWFYQINSCVHLTVGDKNNETRYLTHTMFK